MTDQPEAMRNRLRSILSSAGDAALNEVLAELLPKGKSAQQGKLGNTGAVFAKRPGETVAGDSQQSSRSNAWFDFAASILGHDAQPSNATDNDAGGGSAARLFHRLANSGYSSWQNAEQAPHRLRQNATQVKAASTEAGRDAVALAGWLSLSGAVIYFLMLDENNRRDLRRVVNNIIENGGDVAQEIRNLIEDEKQRSW